MNPANILSQISKFDKNFNINFGSFSFASSYLQAGAIVFLIFLLILTLAQMRRHFINWSVKGGVFGIFFGFLLALILEGFLVISGRTALTELLGWKNAPKPIVNVLDMGRAKLAQTLGASVEVPGSYAKNYSSGEVIKIFQSLTPTESQKARSIICQP